MNVLWYGRRCCNLGQDHSRASFHRPPHGENHTFCLPERLNLTINRLPQTLPSLRNYSRLSAAPRLGTPEEEAQIGMVINVPLLCPQQRGEHLPGSHWKHSRVYLSIQIHYLRRKNTHKYLKLHQKGSMNLRSMSHRLDIPCPPVPTHTHPS